MQVLVLNGQVLTLLRLKLIQMTNTINKIILFAFPILTPGVLILAFLVVSQILDETITWDKSIFAFIVFILWTITFYYYKKLKRKVSDKN